MDEPSSLGLLIWLLILVLFSAFFSASETAFSSFNRIRLKEYANTNKKIEKTLRISEDYDSVLSAILIGNNIVNILAASLSTVLFTKIFGSNGVVYSTFITTTFILIFGEVLPKSLAKQRAENVIVAFTKPVHFFMIIFKPFIFILAFIRKSFTSKMSGSLDSSPSVTENELKHIIDEIQNEGVLEKEEGNLVRSALDFDEIYVEEILTPRVDIVGIDVNDDIEDLKELFFEHKFSRVPVYKDSVDSIIGLINQQDFFTFLIKGIKFDISDIVKPVVHIPPKKLISELMIDFQKNKTHMSIVTDEYGGTIGLITLEDILEELVGDIWDEHDDIVQSINYICENKVRVSGEVNLYDFFDYINYDYRDNSFDINTVNGWAMGILGKMPQVNETFIFDNLKCIVESVDYKRVCSLIVEILN